MLHLGLGKFRGVGQVPLHPLRILERFFFGSFRCRNVQRVLDLKIHEGMAR